MENYDYNEIQKFVRSAVYRSKQHVYAEFEDVVQEAMYFLLKNLKYYDPAKSKMSTFVFMNVRQSLVNQTIHHNAAKRKKNQFLLSLDKLLPTGTASYELVADTANVEDDVMFTNLLNSLTPLEQDIITWWVNGWQWRDFNAKHNIHNDKSLRVRKQLKEKLKGAVRSTFWYNKIKEKSWKK